MACSCENSPYVHYYEVSGIDQSDIELLIGVTTGAAGTGMLDGFIKYDSSGNARDNFIATNDKIRYAGYGVVGTGVFYAADAYMGGMGGSDFVKGVGAGMAGFGIKKFLQNQFPQLGISGMRGTGAQKYIAGRRSDNGQMKYISGSAESNRLDISKVFEQGDDHSAPRNTSKVIINNSY